MDYKTFENRTRKLKLPKLKDQYLASKLIKNYGDIQNIDPETLPDFDGMVRKYIEEIKVYEDKFTICFKAKVEIDIER